MQNLFGGYLEAMLYSMTFAFFSIDKTTMPTRVTTTGNDSTAPVFSRTYHFESDTLLMVRDFSGSMEYAKTGYRLDGKGKVIERRLYRQASDTIRIVESLEYGADGIVRCSRPGVSEPMKVSYDFFYSDHRLDSVYYLESFGPFAYYYKYEYGDSGRLDKSMRVLLPEGHVLTESIGYFLPDSIVMKERNTEFPGDSATTVLYLDDGRIVKRVNFRFDHGISDTTTSIYTYGSWTGLGRKGPKRTNRFRQGSKWMRFDIAGRWRGNRG